MFLSPPPPALVLRGNTLVPPLDAPALQLLTSVVARDRSGTAVQEIEVFLDLKALGREARRPEYKELSAEETAARLLSGGRLWVGLRFRMLIDASAGALRRSLMARYQHFWPGGLPDKDPTLQAVLRYLDRRIDQGLQVDQGFGPDGAFWMRWARERPLLGRSPGLVQAELLSGFGPQSPDPAVRDQIIQAVAKWIAPEPTDHSPK